MTRNNTVGPISIGQEELRGIARTVAEIEWLLLILVLLYVVFAERAPMERAALYSAMLFFAAIILAFRYANFYRTETRWKIALETCAMTLFITWILWFTGKMASPLFNTYLLVIITTALALGKIATLIELALIVVSILFLSGASFAGGEATLRDLGGLGAQIAPLILIAYVTTMFSADIHYGLNKARLLSETDELTGVYNRRGFAIESGRILAHAARYRHPATVMLLDLDNFKTVNDTHGHEAGDRLLTEVVKRIELELRNTDILARFGGDEFIALLPETRIQSALHVAERIRNSISSLSVRYGAASISTNVSIGLASYPENGLEIDDLVARADRAMYEVKKQGRDGVAAAGRTATDRQPTPPAA